MVLRLILSLIIPAVAWGINFHPLPDSLVSSVIVIPYYGMAHYDKLSVASDGGQVPKLISKWGFQVTTQSPWKGWSLDIHQSNSYIGSANGNLFLETELSLLAIKLRLSHPIIEDDFGTMAVFASVGQIMGNYTIRRSKESTGIDRYVRRFGTATSIDIGVVFAYAFNPQWHLFIEAMVQQTMQAQVKNIASQPVSASGFNASGPALAIGSSIQL